jgi:hypothetical protein
MMSLYHVQVPILRSQKLAVFACLFFCNDWNDWNGLNDWNHP